jgi:hypothetical protein
MGRHGGFDCPSFGARAARREGGRHTQTCPHGEEAGSKDAFRNFGPPGRPSPGEIRDWPDAPLVSQALIRKLIRRMSEEHTFADHATATGDPQDNPGVPAGYTYLGQLASHDIVHAAVTAPSLTGAEPPRTNLVAQPLVLDTIYGRGPADDPIAYDLPEIPGGLRETLRLGHIRPADGRGEPKGPPRDIPRARITGLTDQPARGTADVLLPDPRNDDNLNLSQLTTLFHLLHNAVVANLKAVNPFPSSAAGNVLVLRRFTLARRITAAVYRRVLVADLLPRLVRPAVWALYDDERPRPLVDQPDGRVPMEFSDATFRLGHAMVRQTYRLNRRGDLAGVREIIETSSGRRTRETPIRDIWVAQWSEYFEIDGSKPQLSRRIGPSYNEILLLDSLFRNSYVPGEVSDSPDGTLSGLLFRDIVRSSLSELRTVDSLAAMMPPEVLEHSPLLADRRHRAEALRAWLAEGTTKFSPDEADSIANDPPLLFYLLYEAAYEADGKSLGTLGSVIIADTFAGALQRTRDQVEDAPDPGTGFTTDQVVEQMFGRPGPRTMADLIQFVARELDLASTEPAFL